MGILNRDSLSKIKTTLGEPFEIEELGGSVLIKRWSVAVRSEVFARMVSIDSKDLRPDNATDLQQVDIESKDTHLKLHASLAETAKVYSWAIAKSISDENEKLIFDASCQEDLDQIESWGEKICTRLFEEILKRNGVGLESVKTEIKNSETIQS
jgi:aspartokinase